MRDNIKKQGNNFKDIYNSVLIPPQCSTLFISIFKCLIFILNYVV